jgi:hypothetical protein
MKHHEALAVYRKGTALLPKSTAYGMSWRDPVKSSICNEAAAAFSQASSLELFVLERAP